MTSREAILKNCRELVAANGLSSLSMRAVAQKCSVALGSLYNYFPSKDDLAIATIESVWQDIFQLESPCETAVSFSEYVQQIYDRLNAGMVAYPNFFTAHSISFASADKGPARQTMNQYFLHMKSGLLETLKQDAAVQKNAFDELFTPSAFVDFVLSSLLSLLMQHAPTCTVLLKVICRTLYGML